jgi:hypothetical protein
LGSLKESEKRRVLHLGLSKSEMGGQNEGKHCQNQNETRAACIWQLILGVVSILIVSLLPHLCISSLTAVTRSSPS